MADISATVREVARAPLVGTTELPPSDVALPTLPADLPTGSSGTATAAPSPSEPSASLGSVLPAASPSAAGPRVEAPSTAAPPAPRPKVELAARPSPAPESKPEATVGESSRIWVQVAGGADEKLFAAEWRRLKGQAPDLLTTRTAWTTPLKATNRLLVGPFDSQRDAQDFVNKLAPKGITAFAWTSAQGQAITKLATR